MSAPIKNLFDHFAYRWLVHRPEPSMFGKSVLLVSSAAGGGTGKVLEAMAVNLRYWGAGEIFKYGKNVGDFSTPGMEEKIRKSTTKIIKQAIKRIKRKKTTLKTKIIFNLMRFMQKGNTWNFTDKAYWLEKGWLFTQRPWKYFKESDDELWDVLDENRIKTGKTVRRGIRLQDGMYHLVVHVCIFDSNGRLLIQKRQPWKKMWPGLWDLSVGGSAIAGDDSKSAAIREAKEELGIDISLEKQTPLFSIKFETGFDDYWCITQNIEKEEMSLLKSEVSAVKWVSLKEYQELMAKGQAIPYPDIIRIFNYKSE